MSRTANLILIFIFLLVATPIFAAVRDGDRFPAITVTAWDGTPTTLAASADDVLVVYFWASWCLPCRQALPALAHLATQYRAAGLRVVLINIDRDRAAAEKLLAEVLPDHSAMDLLADPDGHAMARLGAPGMPSTYVVAGSTVRKAISGFSSTERTQIENALRDSLHEAR